ncbi:amidoligase family protein [Streptomyces sp. NBC_01433]|uniref:amidoligase family protein n=1 Tax=Streptomyces sp. NBC_01433 TaxID=2903864 RepID=UPI00225493C0|nr:amidoligase family protein [Streptomyces sp. NBC_01433]MCX4682300.1 amidoligase family protein [Streptomyces sp. NBC_01433]
MGSGSRIDHQHHSVAPTRGTDTLVAEAAPLTIEERAERAEVRIIDTSAEDAPLNQFYVTSSDDHMVFLPRRPDVILGQVTDEQDALVQVGGNIESHHVYGDVRVTRGPSGQPEVTSEDLQCLCPDLHDGGDASTCDRRAAMANLIQETLSSRGHTAVDRAAAQEVLNEVAAEHAASIAAQDQARAERASQPAVRSYSDDMDAFQEAYDQARARRNAGEALVPYMTENATGGLGARESGRAFGVEIEFDYPPSMPQSERQAANQRIARDLHAAGIAPDPYMHGWHASAREGYTDAPNAWRLERDGTVAGEIVSPILYDEPQTWNNLAQVCEIVQRNGGIASARTGGHVHVAVPDYDHTVANHNQLINTVAGYEDVIYRVAQNPGADRHRGLEWCTPNSEPSRPYTSVSSVQSYNNSHHIGLNFQSVSGRESDHAEFRMWDGSLDPGTIQAQVNVSLGLTNAALREAGTTPAPPPQRVGHHRRARAAAGQRGPLTGEAWTNTTRSFRSMVDRIFSREENRAQVAALFAGTRWHDGR